MTAVWLWVRSDVRRRWRSWAVLGVLAGISFGLACAGIAGARRTERAVPAYLEVASVPDAVVLANDWDFDEQVRAAVADLPEVAGFHPFLLPFLLTVSEPEGMTTPLVWTTPSGIGSGQGPYVDGRPPDPSEVDELAVNEQARDTFGLHVGSTVRLVQDPPGEGLPFPVPPDSGRPIDQTIRVVGIIDGAGSSGPDATISSAFYGAYSQQLVGFVNAFVDLRNGEADLEQFRTDVDTLTGRPVNVERAADLFGLRQIRSHSDLEARGLWLFALAVLVGAGALVGQALVRAVVAGSADLRTWRAIGTDSGLAVRAIAAPAGLAAIIASITTILVAVLLSPRFPIEFTRQFDLDIGFHADWTVIAAGAIGVALAVAATAWISASLSVRRTDRTVVGSHPRQWVPASALPPSLMIGSRLVTDVGRGPRAVPVRAAMFGAVAGMLSVVACLTFHNALSAAVDDPVRSGVVWQHSFAKAGLMTDDEIAEVTGDPAVAASLRATWARAVPINGHATPTFGISPVSGVIELKVLDGSPPVRTDEIAFAPSTMDALGLHIGDHVTVGDPPGTRMKVVGRVLLPPTSHTGYDQSAWTTRDGLMAIVGDAVNPDEFFEDYLLLDWTPDGDIAGATQRLSTTVESGQGVYESKAAELPPGIQDLQSVLRMPLALAVFMALLAIATVAHALVTTVRRRRTDLAILRSLGFTRGDTRVAVAWQATLLAAVGAIIGVPAGIAVGRLLWKQFADTLPVVYVPPLAAVAMLLAAPVAVGIANALAVGPARSAARVRPAEVLRSE